MSHSHMFKRMAIASQSWPDHELKQEKLFKLEGHSVHGPPRRKCFRSSPLRNITSVSDQPEAQDPTSNGAHLSQARFHDQELWTPQPLFFEMDVDISAPQTDDSPSSSTSAAATSDCTTPEFSWAHWSGGRAWSDIVEEELKENEKQSELLNTSSPVLNIASTIFTGAVKAVFELEKTSLPDTSFPTYKESEECSGSRNMDLESSTFDDTEMSGTETEGAVFESQPKSTKLPLAYDEQNFPDLTHKDVRWFIISMYRGGLTIKEIVDKIMKEGYSDNMFDDDSTEYKLVPELVKLLQGEEHPRCDITPLAELRQPIATEISPEMRKAEFEMFLEAFDERRRLEALGKLEGSFSQTQDVLEID